MSKKAAVATEEISLRNKIQASYMDYILTHGKLPESVYGFCKQLGIAEAEFYNEFSSFHHIEESLWSDIFENTLQRLHSDEQYAQYGAREKLLAFYYTWIEALKAQRSYVIHSLKPRMTSKKPVYASFRESFVNYARQIVMDGQESGEIQNRPFLSEKYSDGLWLQLVFVLNFWAKDDSKNFEQTDAAIEKAVHLSFDLMGRNAIDSAIDLAKFLIQKKK